MAPPYADLLPDGRRDLLGAGDDRVGLSLLGNHLQSRLCVRDRGQVDLDVDPGDGHRGARPRGVAVDLGQQRGALSRVQGRGGTASRDRHPRGEPSQEAADLPVADGHSSSPWPGPAHQPSTPVVPPAIM
jgi:hypothetical protein